MLKESEMGVPKFYGLWLRHQKFPGLFRRGLGEIAGLFIDLNSLIHGACQRVYGYGEFEGKIGVGELVAIGPEGLEARVWKEIEWQISALEREVKPLQLLFLAVDGIAPQAKISQQRSRRLGGGGGRRGFFDSNVISPGTGFMRRLDSALREWLGRGSWRARQVYYSPHTVAGEGEHKIMEYLRRNPAGRNVVHGLDTDLIFLSALSPCRDLYLWRDVSRRERVIIDVEALRRGVRGVAGTVENFVLLCMLLGNDFMPVQPSVRDFALSIDQILQAWRAAGSPGLLEGDYDVVWPALGRVLALFPEERLLARESGKTFKLPAPALTYATGEGSFDMGRYRDFWYTRSGGTDEQWILEKVLTYCQVWQWVIKYYTRSLWEVNRCLYYPYFFAPLVGEVTWGIETALSQQYVFEQWRPSPQRPLEPYEALLVMVPPQLSQQELPAELASLASGPLEPYFPEKFHTEYEGVNETWLGVNYIPMIDPTEVTHMVDEDPRIICQINPEEWQGEDVIFRR